MKTFIAHLILLASASLPVGLMVWAYYLPILVAVPAWGIGLIGVSILALAVWELHKKNRMEDRQ